MPADSWLATEYIKGWLMAIGSFKRKVPVDEFKLLFAIPLEDEELMDIARELGFKVSKRHRCIIIELKKKEV